MEDLVESSGEAADCNQLNVSTVTFYGGCETQEKHKIPSHELEFGCPCWPTAGTRQCYMVTSSDGHLKKLIDHWEN